MTDLDVSVYSSEQLRESRNSENYMAFINTCFGTMHTKYHCFDTPRFSNMDEFYDDFKHPGSVLAVAREPGSCDIVAMGGYRPLDDHETAELKCLCVNQQRAGEGYGGFMNGYVEKLAHDKGFRKMNSVVVRQHGNLVEFYQKLGYKKLEERLLVAGGDDMGFGNVIDISIWFMQKDITA
jgi:hypothetical protein